MKWVFVESVKAAQYAIPLVRQTNAQSLQFFVRRRQEVIQIDIFARYDLYHRLGSDAAQNIANVEQKFWPEKRKKKKRFPIVH